MAVTRAEVCVAACADLFAGDGEILASPMGLVPSLGARLARLTAEPDLLLSDGEAYLLTPEGKIEGWLPYRKVFDVVAHGTRHVVMGANQLDKFGNQNISAIGDHRKPSRQLLGFRGAPGNTANHKTSYWIPRHSKRVLVDAVDVVSGVGYDKYAGPFHHIHRVVTNLAVFDFDTPDRRMRLVSVHPDVDIQEVYDQTGFELPEYEEPSITRQPTEQELDLIRTVLDPDGKREREVRV
ncbi:CoA-transferase subunit beta [Kibdelosporangium aridum]|uniref:Acyl CoA:acetate/3-ketoacid CoA transferase, beta subunit n=1 Tax=Kibdelosporangium aridum TaxID=2030 RepID=A0A1Y5XSH9_KIBAR|nr:CoA-transferase [Kibdelosporangium aridum]SMD09509.1 Acyl CoA:acetate/3-ketoacid CoA transferase, beta subunit [Kibdelosporangium aridum]